MKRKFYLILVVTMVVVVSSCVKRNACNTLSVPEILPVETDSVVFHTSGYTYSLSLEFPTDTSCFLSRAIGEYLSESLGGSFTGSVTDFRRMMGFYANEGKAELDAFANEMEDNESEYISKTAFFKYSENANYVSYLFEGYSYTGGAHGATGVGGATFRKTDGRKIGWDVFRGSRSGALSDIIKKGLMEYWGISSEKELKSYFLEEGDYYDCPLPAVGPVFTDKGVEFIYNQYEIAAYALGIPRFTVPYEELEQYMMTTAKALVRGVGN